MKDQKEMDVEPVENEEERRRDIEERKLKRAKLKLE